MNELDDTPTPKAPEPKNDSARRTHWRGFLKETFSRHGARYLDMHLDPLGAPSPGKHFLRPIFLAAMATGTLNAMSSNEPLSVQLPLHLGAAAMTYVAGRELVKGYRTAIRNGKNTFEFNFGTSKVIDTKPDYKTPATSLNDTLKAMKIASNERFSASLGIGYFGITWGFGVAEILSSQPVSHSATSTAIDTAGSLYWAYMIMRYHAAKNIADGKWVIASEPPAKRQEQVQTNLVSSFTFAPALQPAPVKS